MELAAECNERNVFLFQTSPTRCSSPLNHRFLLSPINICELGSSRCSSIENLANATAAESASSAVSPTSTCSNGGATIPR